MSMNFLKSEIYNIASSNKQGFFLEAIKTGSSNLSIRIRQIEQEEIDYGGRQSDVSKLC